MTYSFNREARNIAQYMAVIIALFVALPVTADISSHQKFGDYTVHFSVFDSTFITPEVAKAYGLTRAGDRALVNISVTRTVDGKTSLGLPARISGTATNLIQQQRTLEFKMINEGEAAYYLAELRHTNEEVMSFLIDVQVDSNPAPLTVRFTRNLHTDN